MSIQNEALITRGEASGESQAEERPQAIEMVVHMSIVRVLIVYKSPCCVYDDVK